MEADFRREYGIILSDELTEDGMSWREFQILLRCLSPNSSTVTKLQSQSYIGSKRNEPVTIEGNANVDHWFEATFKK